jgi:hypothetical protein
MARYVVVLDGAPMTGTAVGGGWRLEAVVGVVVVFVVVRVGSSGGTTR